MRYASVARVVMVIVSLAACRDGTTTRDAALRSLTDVAFSPQYTSAFWDAERTKQSTLWNEARAYCHMPVRQLAPNCRIVNALVEETNSADDEEAVALVREALRAQDRRHERQAWEGLGFGGVMQPEPRASAPTRQPPETVSKHHLSKPRPGASLPSSVYRYTWRFSCGIDPLSA
ncbi:MAG: hypothetical protein AB7K71_39225 [Polyangiaceae bacterium]